MDKRSTGIGKRRVECTDLVIQTCTDPGCTSIGDDKVAFHRTLLKGDDGRPKFYFLCRKCFKRWEILYTIVKTRSVETLVPLPSHDITQYTYGKKASTHSGNKKAVVHREEPQIDEADLLKQLGL